MSELIQWCNDNNGFLTAILSAIGLFLSTIAIVVSIKTARLPFKKRIVIKTSTNLWVGMIPITNTIASGVQSISINVVNKGFRDVNITYLGIMIKNKREKQNLCKTKESMGGMGVIHPTEVHTNSFEKEDIINTFSSFCKTAKVYAYAEDSEGNHYSKYMGTVQKIAPNISLTR